MTDPDAAEWQTMTSRSMHSVSCLARPVARSEIAELVIMCAEHARYERSEYEACGISEKLQRSIFDNSARLKAWVAQSQGQLIGYATATGEYSTWSAREFLHMDCLFVREAFRGGGVGSALLAQVLRYAGEQGFAQVQWQTPMWNEDAQRFYCREGASALPKVRFVLAIAK
ncbi:MAG: GNAT family N-acetyltransferase [Pseudomonadota bacterium]|nr:GNAT family N-acetyltransferase [Pseudomonadota bacterium]